MAEVAIVERVIVRDMLESGVVPLTRREAELLGLPEYSSEVSVRQGRGLFMAEWRAREGCLAGEALAEALELSGQVGGLVTLQRRAEGVEIVVRARPVSSFFGRSFVPIGARQPLASDGPRARPSSKRPRDRYRLRRARGVRMGWGRRPTPGYARALRT